MGIVAGMSVMVAEVGLVRGLAWAEKSHGQIHNGGWGHHTSSGGGCGGYHGAGMGWRVWCWWRWQLMAGSCPALVMGTVSHSDLSFPNEARGHGASQQMMASLPHYTASPSFS